MRHPAPQDARSTKVDRRGKASATLELINASVSELIDALAEGRVTATELTQGYRSRIETYDRGKARLNSVREINPGALKMANQLDAGDQSVKRQPLFGVPVLIKDNIATGDDQATTAGSLALKGARAKDDATLVKLLRDAGAVILGKTNLTDVIGVEL